MEDTAYFTEVPKKYKDQGYTRCLFIRLMGEPLQDTRPRHNVFGGIGAVNTGKLKKRFKPLYNNSFLKETMIHKPYLLRGDFYLEITKKNLAFVKKHPGLNLKLIRDQLDSYEIKDLDNLLKTMNDVLYSSDYRVFLEDAHNIKIDNSNKYDSLTPRSEWYFYIQDKVSPYYKFKIENSAKLFEHDVCYKGMCMAKRTTSEQVRHIRKIVNKTLNYKKSYKRIELLAEVLEEYPVDILKEMAGMTVEGRKYLKYDAVVKVIYLVLSKFPDYRDVILNVMTKKKKKKGR